MIEVERVAVGDEQRAASILIEAASWLIDTGRDQWPLQGLGEQVAEAVAAGEAYIATRDEVDVASWFLNARDRLWWPELGDDHDSRFFHKFAIRRSAAGTGVAGEVLRWSAGHTRDAGCRWLRLDCLDRPAMRQLYESAGFVIVDNRTPDACPERACRYALDVTLSRDEG